MLAPSPAPRRSRGFASMRRLRGAGASRSSPVASASPRPSRGSPPRARRPAAPCAWQRTILIPMGPELPCGRASRPLARRGGASGQRRLAATGAVASATACGLSTQARTAAMRARARTITPVATPAAATRPTRPRGARRGARGRVSTARRPPKPPRRLPRRLPRRPPRRPLPIRTSRSTMVRTIAAAARRPSSTSAPTATATAPRVGTGARTASAMPAT
mmetsp:Transcript_12922/g.39937  ORF Transcript_12922/g.39937 Transcript_12922/m.39937 type:complete len:219 (+) Transcript_12922:563-1219(+)